MDFPMVPLGQVLHRSQEPVDLDPTGSYKQITVRLHHRGVMLRGIQQGSEIGSSRQHRARTGQLILSRIDARNGAIGLVPTDLDGAVVTNDFWLFDIDESQIAPTFLDHYVGTTAFVDLCRRASEGTTNRVRLQPEAFLGLPVPLPPLPEQQRIVARVEVLAAKIEEARRLRQAVAEGIESLARSLLNNASNGAATPTRMSDLVSLRAPDIQVQPTESYHFAGVYSFGRGVFSGHVKAGIDLSYDRLTRLRAGDFVYPKLMAWEGALGVVPPECDGLVVSPEFPVFEINRERVLPEVLDVYFRTPSVWSDLSGASTGTNVRRRRLHPREFLTHEIPLPAMVTQLQLKQVRDRSAFIWKHQSETNAEFDALLPGILDRAFRGEL